MKFQTRHHHLDYILKIFWNDEFLYIMRNLRNEDQVNGYNSKCSFYFSIKVLLNTLEAIFHELRVYVMDSTGGCKLSNLQLIDFGFFTISRLFKIISFLLKPQNILMTTAYEHILY